MITDKLFERRFAATQGGARDLHDVYQHVRNRGDKAAVGTVAWFIGTIRSGKFTDGAGYPKFWLLSDGENLGFQAVKNNCRRIARSIRTNSNDGWRVVGCDINWEDQDMVCDETGERIPPAYS